jgi:hypothetical protein
LQEQVAGKHDVFAWIGKAPGYASRLRGQAGQLIITDHRLVFVKFLKQAHPERVDYSLNIDEALRNPGSLETQLENVRETKFWKRARIYERYLLVRYQAGASEETMYLAPLGRRWRERFISLEEMKYQIDRMKLQKGYEVPADRKLYSDIRSLLCANCGRENPRTNRFCGTCGRSLSDETMRY